jgi:hypothetical protein
VGFNSRLGQPYQMGAAQPPFQNVPFPGIAERGKIAMIKRLLVSSRPSGILTVFSVTMLFATLLWANDPPWKAKPYQQWDLQDIHQVFNDSPWVRVTPINRTWVPATGNELPNEQLAGRARGLPSTQDQSSASLAGDIYFFVLWDSSRVMRAASARQAILQGGGADIDLEKYVNEVQHEYKVTVESADMTPFYRQNEKFFQENAFLEVRKSKQRISPSHVAYKRDQKGALIAAAVFFFPKKTASGDPTIGPDEKGVEFICKLEGSVLRVGFEPQKMVDKIGPDL